MMIAPAALVWLHETAASGGGRVLHVFDRVCNVVNPAGDVLSLVTPDIGAGPFALMTAYSPGIFPRYIDGDTPVAITGTCLQIGSLDIDFSDLPIWNPTPNWSDRAAIDRAAIRRFIEQMGDGDSPFLSMSADLETRVEDVLEALVNDDGEQCQTAGKNLAGWGPGLTPSGDDFLMGVLIALHCNPTLSYLCQPLIADAIPRTTCLSAAWLRAAAACEVSADWKDFLEAGSDESLHRIINSGHTSGTDALLGFWMTLEVLA